MVGRRRPGTGRIARDVVLELAGAGRGRSSRPRWTSPPRPATSFRRSSGSTPAARTTCAASSGTSSARWSTSSPSARWTRAAASRPIDPDSVTVAATGGNTLAVGNVELRVPSPRVQLPAAAARRSSTPAAVWQRGSGERRPVIRVTPGVGIRLATPLGPARLDVAYNPYKLQSGTLFQFDTLGQLTPVPGRTRYVLDREQQVHASTSRSGSRSDAPADRAVLLRLPPRHPGHGARAW